VKILRSPLAGPGLILAAVLLINLLFTPGFFVVEFRDGRLFGSAIDIVNRAVPVLLLALGMTLVIATRGVDLSVGAVMAISGAVAACLIAQPAYSPLGSLNVASTAMIVLIALAISLLCGLFNGALIAYFRVQPIVATLLLMVAGRGVAQLLTGGQIVIFDRPEFQAIGSGASLGLPNPIWIFAAAVIIVTLLTRRTAFGLFIAATGSNPVASEYSGVNSRRTVLTVYAICGLVAGIAGIIGTADIKAADANNAGLYLELDAILAVAIGGSSMAGGKFSIAGSVIGALLMQAVTTSILTRGVAPEATLILKALLVVIVCLLQSEKFAPLTRLRARRAQ
jgi:ribose/xylose/arabinose/galactoside ABC-type transport system permease subunit